MTIYEDDFAFPSSRARSMETLYRLHNRAMLWSITLTLMLADDAAMIAMMFC